MIKQTLLMSTLVAAILFTTGSIFAADVTQGQIYGSQMMTEEERIEHRTKMQNAKTKKERARIRSEHHELMKERAKEKGESIPDKPPVRGNKIGNGQGMGLEQGMGSGRGRNR